MRTRQPPPMSLSVRTGHTTTGAQLTVAGEIDLDSAPQLRGSLTLCLLDGHSVIDVDLAEVTFCDCSGLRVFLDAAKAAGEAGGVLRLHNPSPLVARLFTLTGTGTLLLVLPRHAAHPPNTEPPAASSEDSRSEKAVPLRQVSRLVAAARSCARIAGVLRGGGVWEAQGGDARASGGSALANQTDMAGHRVPWAWRW